MTTTIAALYRFASLDRLDALRAQLHEACRSHGVTGTLLLAHEGINGTIAGPDQGIRTVLEAIRGNLPPGEGPDVKFSYANENPFLRLKVRRKREIVTMGVPTIDPRITAGTYVSPADWNTIISDPETLVIDTRNDYEVEIGTFRGATDPQTKSFRDFPKWAEENILAADSAAARPKRIAMFCTGGIRCEKATAYLREAGVEEVYHLEGGILKYLEEVPAEESLWGGECFVFDQRVAVTHTLEEGSYTLCFACRDPVSEEEQRAEEYVPGVSCPRCFDRTTPAQKARFAERQRQMNLAEAAGIQHLARKDPTSRPAAQRMFATADTD
ncbi:MAG: rhodanese-related sulfurtransferase [Pseudomonadota bacterium]